MPKIRNVSGYDQVIQSDVGRFEVASGRTCDVPQQVADDLTGRPGWALVPASAAAPAKE